MKLLNTNKMDHIIDIPKLTTPQAAVDIIEKSIGQVAAISALPIPFVDMIAMTYIHSKMIKGIAAAYGHEEPEQSKILIISLLSASISNFTSELVTELTEQVGINKILSDNIVKGAIAGFITNIASEVICSHFAQGGSIEDMGFEDLINYISSSATKEKFSTSAIADTLLEKLNLSDILA